MQIHKILKMKNKKLMFILLAVAIAVAGYEYFKGQEPLESTSRIAFEKCVDGDTAHFLVDGTKQTVRFLAIDTPETVKPGTSVQPFGKEASDITCGLITNAKEIRFEYEAENKTDKYNRLLAWVWVDGNLVQQTLIEQGYAELKYIYGDYKYTSQLEAAQTQAQNEKKGIWGD